MVIHDVIQGSAEWYAVRLGKPTASNFNKIVTETGRPSTQARSYMHRLIAERLLNETMDDPVMTEWMEHGRANEPLAAKQFEFATDTQLCTVGFVTDDAGQLGCSPDRLIVSDPGAAVEIKCPSPTTHIRYLLDGPGKDYRQQVQGQMLVCGFDTVHFYSWHPRMPPVHIITQRDPAFQEVLRELLDAFLEELDAETKRARGLGTYVPAIRVETPHQKIAPGPEPIQGGS